MYKDDLKDLQQRLARSEAELRALADADARCALQLEAQVHLLQLLADAVSALALSTVSERPQGKQLF